MLGRVFKLNCDSLSGLLVMAFPRDTYMRLFAAPFKAKIVCRNTEVPSELGKAKIVCCNIEVPSEIGKAKIVCRNIEVPSEIRTSVVIKLGLHVVYLEHANSMLV